MFDDLDDIQIEDLIPEEYERAIMELSLVFRRFLQ